MNKKEINPLVEGNSSLASKIKSKFKKKNNIEEELQAAPVRRAVGYLLGMNDAIPVCAEACACCWDKEIPEGYQNVAEYIAKRTRIGHTSVIEHSNFVVLIETPRDWIDDLCDVLDAAHYLQTTTIRSEDGSKLYTIFGGSYRAYSDLYKEVGDLDNAVIKAITSLIYTFGHSCMFEDLGKFGILDMKRFLNLDPDPDEFNLLTGDCNYEDEYIKIIGMDSIMKLSNNIYNVCPEVHEKLTLRDLIKFVTVTVLFKNMTRTCTHQLVRHRNAITQESQRYVDYSTACFSSPDAFKSDRYSSDHRYTISFGSGPNQKMTLREIGEEICKIYGQLHDPHITGEGYNLLKEDARAYLPGNVQCKKIYMTFTFKNLLKFLELREDSAAQAEIRKYACILGNVFRSNNIIFESKEFCKELLGPKVLLNNYDSKLEIPEGDVQEEIVEMTEEDYIVAAGLDKEENEGENKE